MTSQSVPKEERTTGPPCTLEHEQEPLEVLSAAPQPDPDPAAIFCATVASETRSSQDKVTGTTEKPNPLVSTILSTNV